MKPKNVNFFPLHEGLLNRLEERPSAAMSDFKASAALGSEFAKSLLVQMNPYAAMCNKMLKSVFTALETGAEEVQNPFKELDTATHQG